MTRDEMINEMAVYERSLDKETFEFIEPMLMQTFGFCVGNTEKLEGELAKVKEQANEILNSNEQGSYRLMESEAELASLKEGVEVIGEFDSFWFEGEYKSYEGYPRTSRTEQPPFEDKKWKVIIQEIKEA